MFKLKNQKKFESISLRISAKFELVITFVCCMYMFSRKLQSNQYVSLDHLIGLLLMNYIMILTLMRLQLEILSNRWLQSSMSDISKLKYAQGISVHFLLSFSLKSTTCIYFVTSKATGACMHTFTSPNTIRI